MLVSSPPQEVMRSKASSMSKHAIRAATERDAAEVARLLTALGHPTASVSITTRWTEWRATGNSALVAALDDGRLAGVATLHRMTVLHRPKPVGRITALV